LNPNILLRLINFHPETMADSRRTDNFMPGPPDSIIPLPEPPLPPPILLSEFFEFSATLFSPFSLG
jgi:hypothetical protein